MSFIKQPETAEPNKPAEAEIEGNIRELVRGDSTNLRQVGGASEVALSNLSSLLRRVLANSTRAPHQRTADFARPAARRQ